MAHGINAAVAAAIPVCAKGVNAATYFMAVRCDTYEEAYHKWLLPIAHLLPIPLVKPWKRVGKNQKQVLATTSQYSQGNTAPVDHGYRATEASHSVAEFSEGAHKPERSGKNSHLKVGPRSKARAERFLSRRIPVECVCKGCGRDVRHAWAIVNGDIIQTIDHDKCMDQRVDTSVLAPKAGMFRGKREL